LYTKPHHYSHHQYDIDEIHKNTPHLSFAEEVLDKRLPVVGALQHAVGLARINVLIHTAVDLLPW
jgi:hypothetical protein